MPIKRYYCSALLLTVFYLVTLSVPTRAASFEPAAACVGNANLLMQAVLRYAEENDTHLPPMDTQAHFQAAVGPYVTNPSTFMCPENHNAYVPNASLSNKSLFSIANWETTIIFQDAQPHSDGKLTVAFADFHIELGGVEVGDPEQLCIDRTLKLVQATVGYAQDHDEVFPPMGDSAQFKAAILPYLPGHVLRYFRCPITNQPFQPNPALSGVTFNSIRTEDHSQIWVVRDSGPHPDGLTTVAYLDGHAQQGNLISPTPSSLDNVKQVLYGVIQYLQDYEEIMPPMSPYSTFVSAILPYVLIPPVFLNADRQLPYILNTSLSGQHLLSIADPTTTEFMRDPAINFDGSLSIGYVDGHAVQQLYYLNDGVAMGSGNSTELFWNQLDGNAALWTLSATGDPASMLPLGPVGGRIAGISITGNHYTWVLRSRANSAQISILYSPSVVKVRHSYGPFSGWNAIAMGMGPNNQPCLLWTRYDGMAAVWFTTTDGQYLNAVEFNAASPVLQSTSTSAREWSAVDIAVDRGNNVHVLGKFSDGTATSGTIPLGTNKYSTKAVLSSSSQQPVAIAVSADNLEHILRAGSDGSATIVTLNASGHVVNTLTLTARSGSVARGLQMGTDGFYRVLWRNNDDSSRLQVLSSTGAIVTSHEYTPYQ